MSIRKEITKKIIAALKKVPRPVWIDGWLHSNALTGEPYYWGLNPLLLELHAEEHGFRSRCWATVNQWKQLGCQVKQRPDHVEPGHWGARLAVYVPFKKPVKGPIDEDEEEEEPDWFLKRFVVFNAQQVTGAAAEKRVMEDETVLDYEPAEKLIRKTGAKIRFGGERAFYRMPTPRGSWPNHTYGDFIQMPQKSRFMGQRYYHAIFHELAHWSEVRVGWDEKVGSRDMQEMVAEIASCYLAAELGVPNSELVNDHASYIKGHLENLMGNKDLYHYHYWDLLTMAFRQASKECDFLLSFVRRPNSVEAA